MTEIVLPPTPVPIRPPVGLLLSIGELRTNAKGTEYPARLDHFRAKPGKLGQYETEVAAFLEHYGAEPKSIDDMKFIANDVPAVLDIRLLAFSKTGFRGRGLTNYADNPFLSREEFYDRTWSFQDTFLYYPRDAKEVRAELREAWEGEPIEGVLEGPADPRIAKLGIKVTATLEFQLPEIMGVGRCARISTSSKRSISNLYAGLWQQWWFWGERLIGIPFRLAVRPHSGQRFVKNENIDGQIFTGMIKADGYELVLDTPLTEGEIFRRLGERRQQLGAPTRAELQRESAIMTQALALPVGSGEEEQTREEPAADALSDALLNRLAALLEEAGSGGEMMLRGVFGVDSATELALEDAERLEQMLLAALPAEEVEGEVLEESSGEPGPSESRQARDLASDAPEPSPLDDPAGGAPSPAPPADDYEEEPEPGGENWGATIIPGNLRMSGKTLAEVHAETKHVANGGSIGWALRRNPDLWPVEFRWALAAYALEQGIEP